MGKLSRQEVDYSLETEHLEGLEEFVPDRGPWTVSEDACSLQSDDFTYDAAIVISGDFTEETRRMYANDLAEYLNSRWSAYAFIKKAQSTK